MSISRLEEELGIKLFGRTPKGLFLTEEGEYLLSRAEQIMKIVNDCEAYFDRQARKNETVSVMFVRGTVEKFALNTIAQFKELHPNISVQVQVGTDADCDTMVESGEIDLAVRAGPVNMHKFSATLIYTSKNVLVVNKDNLLAQKKQSQLNSLKMFL